PRPDCGHLRRGERAVPRHLARAAGLCSRRRSARRGRLDRGAGRPLPRDGVRNRLRAGLLAVAVGLALADSSIVTLALPRILGRFDVGITTVAWVLTSFNLVLAVVAVPCAAIVRRRPNATFAGGAVLFAGASLVCGLAPAFAVLLSARCVQAVGAALLVVAALDLGAEAIRDRARAICGWVLAGRVGAVLGAAGGGALTLLLS